MKGYLLDTNIALIAGATPERLTSAVHAAIEEGPAFLSVMVYWEVVVKSMKGALDVGNPRQWWLDTLQSLKLSAVLLRPEHISEILILPPIHRDPFDRALLAQAAAEELTLLTTNHILLQYGSDRLRVLS